MLVMIDKSEMKYSEDFLWNQTTWQELALLLGFILLMILVSMAWKVEDRS